MNDKYIVYVNEGDRSFILIRDEDADTYGFYLSVPDTEQARDVCAILNRDHDKRRRDGYV